MSNKSSASSQVISLPQGGGALQGIGEKFAPDLHTGTGNFTIPIAAPTGRNGVQPQLNLVYSTGNGNGPWGLGWSLSVPGVSRRTSKGVPRYDDTRDVFILSGAEDLVSVGHEVGKTLYRPRTEGLFARIEHYRDAQNDYWKVWSKDGLVSFYGTPNAAGNDPGALANPSDSTKVFAWKLTRTEDPFGNRFEYEYLPDTGQDGPHHYNQLYLKRIWYVSYEENSETKFLVSVTFVYEDRPDPFSEYRSGFDVRTRRRCAQIEIRTHAGQERLVRVYHLIYLDERDDLQEFLPLNGVSLLSQVQVVGHDGDQTQDLPALEFAYTRFEPDMRDFFPVTGPELPARSLADPSLEMVDLFGNGLPDVFEMNGMVRYWRNLGDGVFDLPRPMSDAPAGLSFADPDVQLIDADGDGRTDLLVTRTELSGYFPLSFAGGWDRRSFQRYPSAPSFNLEDPEVRLVDLDGDGVTDAIRSGTRLECFFNHPKEGWSATRWVERQTIEEFPNINFSDPRVKWADMSGDGLQDIVLVYDGNIEYWPNLGHGNWARRIVMEHSPRFPYGYDPERILIGDVNGDGVADVVYVDHCKVLLWINQSGNSWSDPIEIDGTAPVAGFKVGLVDLLGTGISGVLWSADAHGQSADHMFFLDFTGGLKPYLLDEMDNHTGALTRVQYAPSTRFYLEDQKRRETQWKTPLPFPVQVVERVETYDWISRNRFVTRFAYHHGYWDGVEREFRGFGMVEQWDTEEFSALESGGLLPVGVNENGSFHVPPIRTKTWFHTGSRPAESISQQFKDEYYREPGLTDEAFEATLLPDTTIAVDLTAEEKREACRALSGRVLRQEIYAEDQTSKAPHPYSVAEHTYKLRLLHPKQDNPHAVFYAYECETLTYYYERNPKDPRISHALTLEVDNLGNVLKSAAVGYPRRPHPERTAEQERTYVTYTESDYTNGVHTGDAWRTPLPCEARTYELTNVQNTDSPTPYRAEGLLSTAAAAVEIPYETLPSASSAQKRLIERLRTIYLKNDLSGPLLFGQVESLALPYERYKLAFTPGLLDQIFVASGKIAAGELSNLLSAAGKYQDLDGDGHWWIPSGQLFFSPIPKDPPPPLPPAALIQDPVFAANHFYLPQGSRDPFSNIKRIAYDAYDLLMQQTEDPLGNGIQAENDYRAMQPWQVTDANGNRGRVAFDVPGMVVGTAVMGKETEAKGDSLTGFQSNLPEETIIQHFADPLADPHALLAKATTRLVYDLKRYQRTRQTTIDGGETGEPNGVSTLARETHDSDLEPGEEFNIRHSFTYFDGFGRAIQTKIQAEPGMVDGVPVDPRWVGTGWTIFNNKGKPLRRYEPFFSATHAFELAKQVGVSSTLFYDPVGRVVATLHPNHNYEKIVFDPWKQTTWDVNDTVTQEDPKNDPDVGGFFANLDDAEFLPTWYTLRKDEQLGSAEKEAAIKAAAHANTPTMAHLDTLGRTFLTITDNGEAGKYETRMELDIEGNPRTVIDAQGRVVTAYDYDMLGNRIHQAGMDAGRRWILNDATGKPIRTWNSRGHAFRTEYDALHRPLQTFVKGAAPDPDKEILFEQTEYGENLANAMQFNLRTKIFRQFDGAGVVKNEEYDFKGNLLSSSRQLATDYETTPDWSGSVTLEPEAFTGSTTYDALNRPVTLTTPDKSTIRPGFNEAGLLEKVEIRLPGTEIWASFVKDIDYSAKGQRGFIEYGNGVKTSYQYDPLTFRLTQLTTARSATHLQDLHYIYDAAGNIVSIRDDAQQDIYFNGQVVLPQCDYTYDAIYRLIAAKSREHIGQLAEPQTTWSDEFRVNLPHPHVASAMRNYTEQYEYDTVGNCQKLIHQAANGNWTRGYAYNEASLIEPAKKNNRLSSTAVGLTTETYAHDAHGNMTQMPHLSQMDWNFEDQLARVDLGGGGKAYYVYDAVGQRARKVVVKNNESLVEERIYLGGYEIFRQRNGNGLKLERATLHIMDDKQRIALVETRTLGEDASPAQLIRYQLGNLLGSAILELDDQAQIISYEEYYPYGGTSYQAVRSQTEVPLKRYRYTGKERDEETGFSYHGARYYAPWLGRWTAADPAELVDGPGLYNYCKGSPVMLHDPSGTNTPQKPSDKDIMMMTDAQLHAHLAGMSGEARADFRANASGAFKQRVQAHLDRYKLEAIRTGVTTVEHVRPDPRPQATVPDPWAWADAPPRMRRTPAPFGMSDRFSIAPDAPYCRTSDCHQPGFLTTGQGPSVEEVVGGMVVGTVSAILGGGTANAPSDEDVKLGRVVNSLSEEAKIWESTKFFALWYAPGAIARSARGRYAAFEGPAEFYYRTMSPAQLEQLESSGLLLGGKENFLSPTRFYSEALYGGELVEFRLAPGTTERLTQIGVRNQSRLTAAQYGELPLVEKGWMENSVLFKAEGPQVNIGVGTGPGLNELNEGVVSFRVLGP